MIKVPLSWLKDFVEIDDNKWSPEALAAGLTLRGLEVEAIIRTGAEWDKIVVGQVLSTAKHPNADRLGLVQTTDGQKTYQVITGAMNLKPGDKIALALPGAKLIDGHALEREGKVEGALKHKADLPRFVVKAGKMRGVESDAVACAEFELGVSEYFVDIMVLDPDAPVGTPLAEVLGDTILDLDLSPNLGRALSILGIAREVAAMTGQQVKMPGIEVEENGEPIEGRLSVTVEASDLCPRFDAMLIENIKIGPSPKWMQKRLQLTDQPVINNVVDVTNYVMLELGQPLHAYDYSYLHGHELIVRRARPGEPLEFIDHKERELNSEMVVVADADRGLGLAGVMGGLDSEIRDDTTQVALEGARWDAFNIRQTARGLGVVSEAAKRYERTVDINLPPIAVRRAAQLMQQIAGATVAQGLIDVYPEPQGERVLELPMSEISRLLGIEVPKEQVISMLEGLEFQVALAGGQGDYHFGEAEDLDETIVLTTQNTNQDTLLVKIPTYRNDVTIKADLVEEIARMYGYDKIPETQLRGALPRQTLDRPLLLDDKVREVLTGSGLNEVITYTLLSLEDLKRLYVAAGPTTQAEAFRWQDPQHLLHVINPSSNEHEYMRPTLLSSLLNAVGENRRFNEEVFLFELGRVYLPQPDQPLPDERRTVTMAMVGPRHELSRFLANPKSPDGVDFFDLKGIIETLLERLDVVGVTFEPAEPDNVPWFHPGRVAAIYVGSGSQRQRVGIIGEAHPQVVEAFKIPTARVAMAELDLAIILNHTQPEIYRRVTRVPATVQDLAVIVDDDIPAARIENLIRETGGKLLVSTTLFDLYRGKPIPEGKKSLAYSLAFQAEATTMTEDEATKLRQKIEKRLQREIGAGFRA